MELNERKEKILDAVIRNYLETGEPVGSRTISKYTDLSHIHRQEEFQLIKVTDFM